MYIALLLRVYSLPVTNAVGISLGEFGEFGEFGFSSSVFISLSAVKPVGG